MKTKSLSHARIRNKVRARPSKRKFQIRHIHMSTEPEARRKCAYAPCGKRFHPKRYFQKFHSQRCRKLDWEARHPRFVDPEGFK